MKTDFFTYKNCDNVWEFKIPKAKLTTERLEAYKTINFLQIIALKYGD